MATDDAIKPATIEQVQAGADGKFHVIDNDAGGIVARLKRLDENLNLRFSEAGNYYVVYYQGQNGPELVATYETLDARIAEDIERMDYAMKQPGYNFADELEKLEAEAKREEDYRQKEAMGESAQKLAHALRKDMGFDQGKIFVSKDIKV